LAPADRIQESLAYLRFISKSKADSETILITAPNLPFRKGKWWLQPYWRLKTNPLAAGAKKSALAAIGETKRLFTFAFILCKDC